VARTIGVPRKVDDLGRIVVPVEYRRRLGIGEGDELEVSLEDDRIVLARAAAACTFCQGRSSLRAFHGRQVCADCIEELTAS
jgi:AbrB family transcriptional regulator, transcriptional pleiotropic regulator of transition state genes